MQVKLSESDVDQITCSITNRFRCFGGGRSSPWGNPLAEALKDRPAQFAAGVDVREVVRFVADEIYRIKDE